MKISPKWVRTASLVIMLLFVMTVPGTLRHAQSQTGTSEIVESDAPQVGRVGEWHYQVASGGGYLYNAPTEAALILNFAGPSVEIIYVAGPGLGTLAIEVDGTVLRTVITTADTTAYGQSAKINYLTDETHELKVYAQGGGVVGIDAFAVEAIADTTPASAEEAMGQIAGGGNPVCGVILPVQRVSVASGGVQGNGGAFNPALSADGRYVAFRSFSSNLVPNDTNNATDVFVHDRQTCQTTRVSVSSAGVQGNGESIDVSISGDGRYVAFSSAANNLVAGDTTGFIDVFVHDRQTGETQRASVSSTSEPANQNAFGAQISDDGRYVTFISDANNLVTGDTDNRDLFIRDLEIWQTRRVNLTDTGEQSSQWTNENYDLSSDGRYVAFPQGLLIYVRDLVANTTTEASVGETGQSANLGIHTFKMSGDGRYVIFGSPSTNLVAGATPSAGFFVRDRVASTTTFFTIGQSGILPNQSSSVVGLSNDARFVLIYSTASNLVPNDTNGSPDLFVHDRQTNITTRVSLAQNGSQLVDASFFGISLAANGRVVTFATDIVGVVPDDTNAQLDVFAVNLNDGALAACSFAPIERVSVSSGGAQSTGGASFGEADLSDDGRFVSFASDATNLVSGDTNGMRDVFVHDRQTCQTTRVSVSSTGSQSPSNSDFPAISADGRYVTFIGDFLTPNDTNLQRDIYVHDRVTGMTTRVNVSSTGTQANDTSFAGDISGDGRYVIYDSYASNLTPGDTNGNADVFVYDMQTGIPELASLGLGGQPSNGVSTMSAISADGRYVTFVSNSRNLVAGASQDFGLKVYWHDRQTDITVQVSVGLGGVPPTGGSYYPRISADGHYIAFEADARNLVPGDSHSNYDIFLYDRLTTNLTRVNIPIIGTEANSDSHIGDISPDGRYITYASYATNLVIGDVNNAMDAFVYDGLTATTIRVSVNADLVPPNAQSSHGQAITNNGILAMASFGDNLVAGDTNGVLDVFVRELPRPDTLALLRTFPPAQFQQIPTASLLDTLLDFPPASSYRTFQVSVPETGQQQLVMGDWDGDGVLTPGALVGGTFYYSDANGYNANWSRIWVGLNTRPVAGRFNAEVNHDCIGVIDSTEFPPYGTAFALYFACDLTNNTAPPLANQWLSVLLPNSGGFSGTHQFAAGDFNGNGVDSIAVRRGSFIAFTDTPPTTLLSEFNRAQYIGQPEASDEGLLVAGDWNADRYDTFGLFYQNGRFYRRNDLEWNSGNYILQQVGQPLGAPLSATSW